MSENDVMFTIHNQKLTVLPVCILISIIQLVVNQYDELINILCTAKFFLQLVKSNAKECMKLLHVSHVFQNQEKLTGFGKESIFGKLQSIEISTSNFYDEEFQTILPIFDILSNHFKELTKLVVVNNLLAIRSAKRQEENIAKPGSHLSKLESFAYISSFIYSKHVKLLALYCPQLKTLVLDHTIIFGSILILISSLLFNLETIRFDKCQFDLKKDISVTALWPKLRMLTIEIDLEQWFQDLSYFQSHCKFICLEKVEIILIGSVNTTLEYKIITQLLIFHDVPSLRLVYHEMRHSDSFITNDFETMFEHCKNLKEFIIIFNDEYTFDNISFLLGVCAKYEFFPVKIPNYDFSFAHISVLQNYTQSSADAFFEIAGYVTYTES